jgi:hydrogenase nickel incorporation protein HypA/HybF
MHEYSIVQALLRRVEESIRAYEVTAVRGLRLRIGALSGVDGSLLRIAYELCAPGTCCDGAALDIEDVPVCWRCPRCGQEPPAGQRLVCPGCGGPVRLAAGDEIVLEKIDLEVNDV